ncbi:MAG TPA: bifunctional glycosyltransferase/class I SAM-dependent methyltransferase [Thermoanaerobaculia bacterium]|nr:bifunctional glycosyltransferase/class I SAM-dependent methyltransferase [Thermoanaerobaculia bacterium]
MASTSHGTAPSISVIADGSDSAMEALRGFLRGTGLTFEVIAVGRENTSVKSGDRSTGPRGKDTKGTAIRRAVLESRGEVVTIADPLINLEGLSEGITLVQSGATDIAIAGSGAFRGVTLAARALARLVLSEPAAVQRLAPAVLSRDAAQLLFHESRVEGESYPLEILFLARKYGLRVEEIELDRSSSARPAISAAAVVRDGLRVRYLNRSQAYRSPRRCPVCFSREVFTLTQLGGFVVLRCSRCKCRYLSSFPSAEELESLYGPDYYEKKNDIEFDTATPETSPALGKVNEKRAGLLRRHLPAHARILEAGCGRGLFGKVAASEFEYVGLDVSADAVRRARAEGIEVYRSSLERFVNLGPAFDAVAMFHVFEHFPEPHDVLTKIRDLLKAGGLLFLTTPDTESLSCVLEGNRWAAYRFPHHLILYSRSALIELLEHSGFEIVSATSDFEYRELRVAEDSSGKGRVRRGFLNVLPAVLPAMAQSILIVARRRSGPPLGIRPIRAAEPTHAR